MVGERLLVPDALLVPVFHVLLGMGQPEKKFFFIKF